MASDRGAPILRRPVGAGSRRSPVHLAVDRHAGVASRSNMAVPPDDGAAVERWTDMSAPSWDRIKEVFQEALERPPDERGAWLRQICGNDRALEAEVESL